jgi:hypothetical protein
LLSRRRCRWPALFVACTEAPLHQLGEESIEGLPDDGGEISVGDGVAHQVTRQLELRFQVGVGRELDLVTRWRERLDRHGASAVRTIRT